MLPAIDLSPISVTIMAAICVVTMLAYWSLRRQWSRPDCNPSARNAERAALLLSSVCALLLVVYGDQHLRQRQARAQLRAEMQQGTDLALQIKRNISIQLDLARALLAERAQRQIADHRLAEARAELARFSAFNDPRIAQMIALIDKELAIRQLVAQSLAETAPGPLARIYAQLARLVPDNPRYRASAEHYSAVSVSAGATAATPTGK